MIISILKRVSEERRIISLGSLRLLLLLGVATWEQIVLSSPLVPTSILFLQPPSHECRQTERHGDDTDQNPMSLVEPVLLALLQYEGFGILTQVYPSAGR